MAQSIKLGSNTYLDWTGLAVDYEDVTVTCGTTLFHTMYYGDKTPSHATRNKCVGMYVYNVDNSRPAFPTWVDNTTLRIWSPTDSTEAVVRVFYKIP